MQDVNSSQVPSPYNGNPRVQPSNTSREEVTKVSLIVSRGRDQGLTLELGRAPRQVGRARDMDLILTDLTVSRRHLEIMLVDQGVHVRAHPGAAPFIIDGHPEREAIIPLNGAILVGTTVLCVLPRSADEAKPERVERPAARTLLEGPAAETNGLVAVAALTRWLDRASSLADLGAIISRWASIHADATDAVLHREDAVEDASACDLHRSVPDDLVTRPTDAGVEVTVPSHAQDRAWVTFRFEAPRPMPCAAHLRLLLVAGRVIGSSLGRLHAMQVAEAQLREVRRAAVGSARGFLGTSNAAMQLAALLPKVAVSSSGVLLLGESGVGKTFVARLLHEMSPRAREPLRIVNCASLPEALLESELFGHERGAFTGANAARVGAFEFAGRGTLFLDEVGELSLTSQAKLLRALEERKFERLGSNRTIDLRAWVICATNRDLREMIRRGTFRLDLHYRISALTLQIPPLRERGDDLVLLAEHILRDLADTAGRRIEGFAEDALEAIRLYSWPGNVRELRNALEYAVVLGEQRFIRAADLPSAIASQSASCVVPPDADPALVRLPVPAARLEQLNVEAALRSVGGNRSRAAALLGINRTTLYGKLRFVLEKLDPSLSGDPT